MNGLLNYIIINYNLIILTIGLALVMLFHSNIGNKSTKAIKCAIFVLLVLTIVDSFEQWTRTFEKFTNWRGSLSIMGYSIRPVIPLIIMDMVVKNKNKYWILSIPAILNLLVYLTAFFSPIAFHFTESNNFVRGPLGLATYFTSGFYLILLILYTSRYFKQGNREEGLVIFFMSIACISAGVIEACDLASNLLNTTIASSFAFYYLFMYIQISKRDALTGLLNRQSFYSYCNRNKNKIRAIVVIDMNDLKLINDNKGHNAGDYALRELSECFKFYIDRSISVYRIGGDEFCITIIDYSEIEIMELIKNIKAKVSETPYSCAIGYSIRDRNQDLEEVIKKADDNMYSNKFSSKKEIL